MTRVGSRIAAIAIAGLMALAPILPALALDDVEAMSEEEIARELQNPVADLISVPFQNNVNTGFGPERGTQNVLNIQPVVPFDLNDDWNLITRVILPVTWQPRLAPGGEPTFGLGNSLASLFISPSRPMGGVIWGAGPAISLPTATESRLGSNIWGAGPSAVALRMDGPWVYGALISNIWSVCGHSGPGGNKYNVFTLQPFANYNFGGGWYVTTSPLITANWLAEDDQQWTVPIGAGVGKVVRLFGTLPVNLQVAAYYNVVRPDHIGPVWQIRSQVTFVLPSF